MGRALGRCGPRSRLISENQAISKNQSLSWDVSNCSEELSCPKPQKNEKTVPKGLQVFPNDLVATL